MSFPASKLYPSAPFFHSTPTPNADPGPGEVEGEGRGEPPQLILRPLLFKKSFLLLFLSPAAISGSAAEGGPEGDTGGPETGAGVPGTTCPVRGSMTGAAGGIWPAGVLRPAEEEEEEDVKPERRRGSGIVGNIFFLNVVGEGVFPVGVNDGESVPPVDGV